MAAPLIAGAGIAARGFTTWLAKKKAREAAARAAVRSTGSASIPNLVTSARPSGLGPFASRLAGGGAAVLGGSEAINAMTQQPNGGDLHPRVEAMERLRNPRPHMGMAGLSKGLSRNENYMANPEMDYPSQDPSYDASRTREGKVQALMEQMDGMDISEEAKQQIIQDKFTNINYKPDTLGSYEQFESSSEEKLLMEAIQNIKSRSDLTSEEKSIMQNNVINSIMERDKRYPTESQLKAATFDKVANDSNLPMEQRITAALRRETGAAYNEEEARGVMESLITRDARRETGAAMSPNEMKMFMGMPRR